MKKLAVIISLSSVTALSYGQAYVNFANIPSLTPITTNYYGTVGPTPKSSVDSNAFYFALFVAPTNQTTISSTADPTLNGWTFTGDMGTNDNAKGGMNGYGPLNSSSVEISGYAPFTYASFAVVGWSANLGSTWAQAEQLVFQQEYPYDTNPEDGLIGNDGNVGFFGISSVGQQVLTDSVGPYNDVWGPADEGGIPGMTLLTYVPEPGTLVLCALGATALLFRPRRE
jgi:hypothetical protein